MPRAFVMPRLHTSSAAAFRRSNFASFAVENAALICTGWTTRMLASAERKMHEQSEGLPRARAPAFRLCRPRGDGGGNGDSGEAYPELRRVRLSTQSLHNAGTAPRR